jgi:hypothetical protein
MNHTKVKIALIVPTIPVGTGCAKSAKKWVELHYEHLYFDYLWYEENTPIDDILSFDEFAVAQFFTSRPDYEPTLN